jgi:hypothetical protein
MRAERTSTRDRDYFRRLLPRGVLPPRSELRKLSRAIDELIRRTDDHTERQCKIRRPATAKGWHETVAMVHNALMG